MSSSLSVEEMHELLAVDVAFPNLRLVKIEAHYPISGFDSLLARLE